MSLAVEFTTAPLLERGDPAARALSVDEPADSGESKWQAYQRKRAEEKAIRDREYDYSVSLRQRMVEEARWQWQRESRETRLKGLTGRECVGEGKGRMVGKEENGKGEEEDDEEEEEEDEKGG